MRRHSLAFLFCLMAVASQEAGRKVVEDPSPQQTPTKTDNMGQCPAGSEDCTSEPFSEEDSEHPEGTTQKGYEKYLADKEEEDDSDDDVVITTEEDVVIITGEHEEEEYDIEEKKVSKKSGKKASSQKSMSKAEGEALGTVFGAMFSSPAFVDTMIKKFAGMAADFLKDFLQTANFSEYLGLVFGRDGWLRGFLEPAIGAAAAKILFDADVLVPFVIEVIINCSDSITAFLETAMMNLSKYFSMDDLNKLLVNIMTSDKL